IDNFLIPCFCREFFEDRHPTISGRHHFFPHIGVSIATSFLGAASSRGKLELSDTVFFVVDFKWKLFAFLDSLLDKDSFLLKSIERNLSTYNFKAFDRMYPHVPKQENGWGSFFHNAFQWCGVFATKIMEIWDATLDLRKIFSQADIQHIRIQYMNQLFFWKKNTADKSLVTSFNFQSVLSHTRLHIELLSSPPYVLTKRS
ncbi:hypothetical protein ZWY2020_006971, partial [Hordeum vulgare]